MRVVRKCRASGHAGRDRRIARCAGATVLGYFVAGRPLHGLPADGMQALQGTPTAGSANDDSFRGARREPAIMLSADIELHHQPYILISQSVAPFVLFAFMKAGVCSISPEQRTSKASPSLVRNATRTSGRK